MEKNGGLKLELEHLPGSWPRTGQGSQSRLEFASEDVRKRDTHLEGLKPHKSRHHLAVNTTPSERATVGEVTGYGCLAICLADARIKETSDGPNQSAPEGNIITIRR
jgi:hypothetical protein